MSDGSRVIQADPLPASVIPHAALSANLPARDLEPTQRYLRALNGWEPPGRIRLAGYFGWSLTNDPRP